MTQDNQQSEEKWEEEFESFLEILKTVSGNEYWVISDPEELKDFIREQIRRAELRARMEVVDKAAFIGAQNILDHVFYEFGSHEDLSKWVLFAPKRMPNKYKRELNKLKYEGNYNDNK